MKNLKLGFIALCGFVLAFTSCKKNNDTPAPNNSFVIGGTNYGANLGFYATYGTDETDLIFFNKLPISDTTGVNAAYIAFGGTIPAAGTYTYTSGTVDPAKNFSDVFVYYNSTYSPTSDTFAGGASIDSDAYDATGSTVTISISGSTYTVVYALKFTDSAKKVTLIDGQYSGALTKIN
jgi:hypothetical protein